MADPGPTPSLNTVNTWLLVLNNDLSAETVAQIAASQHDMVVVDFLPSQPNQAAFPIRDTVAALKKKSDGGRRLVVAYLNAGQAEDYRTYWRKGWRVGKPDWILMTDPDGWGGNFPVAFWRPEWRAIVAGPDGLAAQIAAAGFDGAYLDWIGGFQEEVAQKRARRDGVDAAQEMASLVAAIGAAARAVSPGFRVIGQNGSPLLDNPDYLAAIDGVAQESLWFTWGGKAKGDCPVPRTGEEAASSTFRKSLSPACRAAFDADPGSAMRYAAEPVILPKLAAAMAVGKTIFTVDYAQSANNRNEAAIRSRRHGFRPFVGGKDLKAIENPVDR